MPRVETTATEEHASHEVYLKYLDKEMTIMGILSVFAVAAAAMVLDRTLGSPSNGAGAHLWTGHGWLIALATATLMVAALFFYRQRSDLAFWYGQIAISMTTSEYGAPTTRRLVHDADLWSGWRNYFWAFALTSLAFCWYGLVLWERLSGFAVARSEGFAASFLFVVVAGGYSVRRRIFERYDDAYSPWTCWRASLGRDWLEPFFLHPAVRKRVYDECAVSEATNADGGTT